jgi:uncharacterized OB-fold protein
MSATGEIRKPLPVATEHTGAYWQACAEGRLEIQRCARCRAAVFFPRRWCPSCGAAALEQEVASGRGTIYSYSTVSQAPTEAYRAELPYVVALVELEEGPRMMANVVGGPVEAVRVGAPVEVVFEDRGHGMHVPQFELSEGSTS